MLSKPDIYMCAEKRLAKIKLAHLFAEKLVLFCMFSRVDVHVHSMHSSRHSYGLSATVVRGNTLSWHLCRRWSDDHFWLVVQSVCACVVYGHAMLNANNHTLYNTRHSMYVSTKYNEYVIITSHYRLRSCHHHHWHYRHFLRQKVLTKGKALLYNYKLEVCLVFLFDYCSLYVIFCTIHVRSSERMDVVLYTLLQCMYACVCVSQFKYSYIAVN